MSRKSKPPKDTKPRVSVIRLAFDREQTLSGMHVGEDGVLTLFDENGIPVVPRILETGPGHLRDAKPPKAIVRLPKHREKIHTDPNWALGEYAHVFVVDTNTATIGKDHVSMCIPIHLHNIRVEKGRWFAKIHPLEAFEFHDATASAERIGLCDLIDRLLLAPDVGRPVALVVDSDLGVLSQINSREQPILGDFYLPAGFSLTYASAERGTTEYAANAAMAYCDKTATKLLGRLRLGVVQGEYFTRPNVPYARYRYWRAPARADGA